MCPTKCGCNNQLPTRATSLLADVTRINIQAPSKNKVMSEPSATQSEVATAEPQKNDWSFAALVVLIVLLGLMAGAAWWGNKKYKELKRRHQERMFNFDQEESVYSPLN